jgi:hypothetical protein
VDSFQKASGTKTQTLRYCIDPAGVSRAAG